MDCTFYSKCHIKKSNKDFGLQVGQKYKYYCMKWKEHIEDPVEYPLTEEMIKTETN